MLECDAWGWKYHAHTEIHNCWGMHDVVRALRDWCFSIGDSVATVWDAALLRKEDRCTRQKAGSFSMWYAVGWVQCMGGHAGSGVEEAAVFFRF